MQPIDQVVADVNEGRRLRIAYVTPEIVLSVLGRRPKIAHDRGESWLIYHLDGLPEGAKVVGVNFDHSKRAFAIAVEHPDFDVVPAAMNCPELALMVSVTEVPVHPTAKRQTTSAAQ